MRNLRYIDLMENVLSSYSNEHIDRYYNDVKKDGLSFVLYNNVWGTNFPLWYEDNAKFTFEIKKK